MYINLTLTPRKIGRNYVTFAPGLSLKQFILKAQVLELYREIMKTTKSMHKKQDREELRKWIKSEFEKYKYVNDNEKIKELIARGKRDFKRMREHLMLSGGS